MANGEDEVGGGQSERRDVSRRTSIEITLDYINRDMERDRREFREQSREFKDQISATRNEMRDDLTTIKKRLEDTHSMFADGYVTKAEFASLKEDVGNCATKEQLDPIKRGVYGMIAIVMTAVLYALLHQVIIQRLAR